MLSVSDSLSSDCVLDSLTLPLLALSGDSSIVTVSCVLLRLSCVAFVVVVVDFLSGAMLLLLLLSLVADVSLSLLWY